MNKLSRHFFIILITFAGLSVTISSCKKEETNSDLDKQLYDAIKSTSGYLYYQNGDTLPGVSPSPHGAFRLRFNSIAQSVLDSINELPTGSTFPTGSILVKEVYKNNALNLLVVMKKNPSGADAAGGWQWAELNPDGSVFYSSGKQGEACVSCHQSSPNRDLTKTFNLH